MVKQSYLIDTNILIGLEDYHRVKTVYAELSKLASAHSVDIFVHEAAKEDIRRDKDIKRREISLSKIDKYRVVRSMHGLTEQMLETEFGSLNKPNDIVDAKLLHTLNSGAVDFLVTQDKGLHDRAQRASADLGRRVLFISDAVELITQTYKSNAVPIRHVAEVKAHEIDHKSVFFNSLRHGYPEFDDWWIKKCVKEHRDCWVVYDADELAGLIVRKDETDGKTDALTTAKKILKICTFKVSPNKRGVKLGELLLKKVLWYAQSNDYDLTYLTTYEDQASLINLLEFYGFRNTGTNESGELIYERSFSKNKLSRKKGTSPFDLARINYPRFLLDDEIKGFGIPIKEGYHDTLYPDLYNPAQSDLFAPTLMAGKALRPGNTIRKVYLCRAQSKLSEPGSILFFYKGKSKEKPSQAMTAVGILESLTLAHSTKELMQLTGGRSVYSEEELDKWGASETRPVKVINYLLITYIDPPIELDELKKMNVIGEQPQQSIYQLSQDLLQILIARVKLDFKI